MTPARRKLTPTHADQREDATLRIPPAPPGFGPAFELDESRDDEWPTGWEVLGLALLVCIVIAFFLMVLWAVAFVLLDILSEPTP